MANYNGFTFATKNIITKTAYLYVKIACVMLNRKFTILNLDLV